MSSTLRRAGYQILRKQQYGGLSAAAAQRHRSGPPGPPEPADTHILTSKFKDVTPLKCSVPEFMWQNLDRWPDKTATVCAVTGHGYTYAQTHRLSMTFAASLRKKLGLREDDCVAVVLPNVPEYPCVLMGALQAGCVASIMNPHYTSSEFKRQLETVNCKAVVTCKVSYAAITEALNQMQQKLPVVLVENEDLPEGAIKFAEFAEDLSVDIDCLKSVQRGPNDVAVIPFSSGTTGFPKGVVLTHGSIVALNQMISDPVIVAVEETTASYQAVIPAALPFFHIFGFNVVMMNQMYLGCKLVTLPYFKPDLFLNTIAQHKAAALFIVPPMALLLGKHPAVTPAHLDSVKAVICGAAPLSVNDIEQVLAKNPKLNFRQGMGLTETNGTISIGHNKDSNHRSVGFVIGGTEVKIADLETGRALPAGQEGEIWYRGANVMRGYHNNEEATREVFTPDNWLKTGDVGAYDDHGYLYVTDRIKELIKVKGFQVPPAELEALIRTHPKVLDCAVVGVPDKINGESPKAFLVPRPGESIQNDELKEFVNSRVTEYKKIKHVQVIDAIPKSPAGKILRKDLKAKYC